MATESDIPSHPGIGEQDPLASGSTLPDQASPPARFPRRRLLHRYLFLVCAPILLWLTVAYVVMPMVQSRYTRRHPSLADIPGVTHTGTGIPGDPLNVALVGTKADVMQIMIAAKWLPADELSLISCLEIAEASVFKRPYEHAPVSNLYLFGRKEDLAFEQLVHGDPRQRHHVRFWQSDKIDSDGRPVWLGSAIYDRKVGLSRDTGQITQRHRAGHRFGAGQAIRRPEAHGRFGGGVHRRGLSQGPRRPQRRRRPLVHGRQPVRWRDPDRERATESVTRRIIPSWP